MKMIMTAITFLLIMTQASYSQTLAPDGSWVGGNPRLAPDGNWVGGNPRFAPDGNWVGGNPRQAPDGNWVGGNPRLAPDGNWVGGNPRLAPDGSWVGVRQRQSLPSLTGVLGYSVEAYNNLSSLLGIQRGERFSLRIF